MANLFSLNVATLEAEHRAKLGAVALRFLCGRGSRSIEIHLKPSKLFHCYLYIDGAPELGIGGGMTKEEALAQALHAWTLNGSK